MKKGFTLIELLAVIVILAIIALIATPLILNVIDDAKIGAFKNTAYGIIETAELEYATDILNNEKEDITYKYENGQQISPENKSLKFKGETPKNGEIIINKKGKIALAIHNGKHCIEKGFNEEELKISESSVEECVVLAFPDNNRVCGEDYTDERDGYVYQTVKIGKQCWMKEDMKYVGNGCLEKVWNTTAPHDACIKASETELQNNESHREWLQNVVWYQFSVALDWDGVNPATPGELQSMSQGICPSGWFIPTLPDYSDLLGYIGENAGTKMKSDIYWNGTNDYGFNALPCGHRSNTNVLQNLGTNVRLLSNYMYMSLSFGLHLTSIDSEGYSAGEASLATGRVVRCFFK